MPIDGFDAQIAAICRRHAATLATRNGKDFEQTGVEIVDRWRDARRGRLRDSLRGMLETGTNAPDFTLPDQDGDDVRLADLRGQTVVLYFYPKADT